MAEAMEGIMGLPNAPMDGGAMALDPAVNDPLLRSMATSNPKQFRTDMMSGLEEADPQLVAQFRNSLSQIQMPPELLAALQMIVDAVLENPEGYVAIREMLLKEEVPEELLPEQFDPAYFMAFAAALDQIEAQTGPAPMNATGIESLGGMEEPQGFAEGGIAELKPIAKAMAQMGRGGDTMLAHINPREARLLKQLGGSGTINPNTGLPEFFFKKIFRAAKKVVKSVVKTVKNVVSAIAENPIGRIALTIGATMLMGPAGLNFAGALGAGSGALAYGINAAAASTLVNVASGQSFGDALKSGIVSGVMAGGTAALFPSTLPSAYTEQAAQAAAASNAAASGIPVENLTTKAGDLAATPGTGFTGAPGTVADVSVGTPVPEVYTPSDVGVSAMAPTPAAPIPSMGAQPVWDPNLGEMTLNGIPASQITAGAPTAVAPMGAYNMPASYANPALAQTPAPSLGGGYSVADQYGTAMSRAPVTGAGAAPAAASTQSPGFFKSLGQGEIGDAFTAAKQNTMDFYNEYLSPSRPGVQGGDVAQIYNEKMAALRLDPSTFNETVYKEAAKEAANMGGGMLAKYAPLAGVGLGAAYLGGAFEPIPEEPPLDVAGMYDYELQPLQYGGLETTYQRNPYTGEGGTQFRGTGYQGQYQFQPYTPYDYTNQGIGGLTLGQMPDLGVASMPSFQRYAEGGSAEYPRKNGHISGPGGPKDDKIPAMLSDGEFVFTAQAVRNMGNGSRRAGAKKMYALMKALEGRSA
jgi:hypothetical protein